MSGTPLGTRLARLRAQAGAAQAAPAPAPESTLRQRLARVRPARVQGQDRPGRSDEPPAALAAALGGQEIDRGLIRIDARFPLDAAPGGAPLRGLQDIPVLPGESAPPPAVYVDTETTGLAGGSGTLAFLVGLAYVDGKQLQLTQLLMTRFDAERSLLRALTACLPAGHRLASFNGKSYDLPLLITRFRMQGLAAPFATCAHLDLLHPVRRVFGRRWSDCRLTTLERELLGFVRTDDLPGAEAPDAWFDYMRAGRATRLIKVVEHNRQDILSLAAAHPALADAVARPDPARLDLLGLARWLAEATEDGALALLDAQQAHLCSDGRRFHAHLLRRAGRWAEAVQRWEELARQGCADAIERLAKYHEHVTGDLAKASDYCRRLPASAAVTHRARRLAMKLESDVARLPDDERSGVRQTPD